MEKRFKDGVTIEINYPDDGGLENIELSDEGLHKILANISGTTETMGIQYYIASDYINELSDDDFEKIDENCEIYVWDNEDDDFDIQLHATATRLGIEDNELLDLMGY